MTVRGPRYIAARLKFDVIDGCPVPRRLAKIVRVLKSEVPGATLNSCYRGDDAAAILHAHGKHTQRELYDRWRWGWPGYYPANQPGRSTHEARSDGVAYKGPVGRVLEWWQCGMDFDDDKIDALVASGHRHGWYLFRPYPGGSEHHHLNLRRAPTLP